MSSDIVARLTANGEALVAETGRSFKLVAQQARDTAKEIGPLIGGSLESGVKQAEAAYRASFKNINELAASASRTNGVVQFDIAGSRAALAASQEQLLKLREVAAAFDRVAAEEGEAAVQNKIYAAAARAAVADEERNVVVLNSKVVALERVQAELGGTITQQNRAKASAGQLRAGSQQLSFQLNDVATSFAAGTPPMVIFAQQGSQVVQAISLMKAEAGGFIGFLGGPWFAAITLGATLLGSLLFAHKKAGEGSEEQGKKEKTLTERIAEQNARLRENILLQGDKLRAESLTAQSTVAESQRDQNKAQSALDNAVRTYNLLKKQGPEGSDQSDQLLYELNLASARDDVVAKTKALTAATKALKDASVGVTIARGQLIEREVAGQLDPAIKETQRYEDALGKLTDAHTKTLITDAQYKAAILEEGALHKKNTKALEEATKAQNDNNRAAASLPKVTGQEVAKLIGTTVNGGGDGSRSAARNKSVGGATNSYHLIHQAIDIPLTLNGKPLTKAGIREALEPAGIIIKELLGPGDKGHDDHFHIAFDKKRAGPDKVAANAEKDAAEKQRALDKQIEQYDKISKSIASEILQKQEAAHYDDLRAQGLGAQAEKEEAIAQLHARYSELLAGDPASAAKALGITIEQVNYLREQLKIAEKLTAQEVSRANVGKALKAGSEKTQKASKEAADAADKYFKEQDERAKRQFEDLASFYERAFSSGGKSIWQDFKREGFRVLAELAAQATLSLLGGGGNGNGTGGPIGGLLNGTLGRIFGGSGSQGNGIVAGGQAGLPQLSNFGGLSSAGGAIGAGLALNQLVGSILGVDQVKNGKLLSLVIGPVFAKLLGSSLRGSATLGFTNGELGVGSTRGNSKSRIDGASDGISSLADTLNQIADGLGGSITGAGSVSIGIRKKKYVVDTTGKGRTKGAGVLSFKDEEEALQAALKDAISDGVINGISAASQNILRSGQDLQKAIEKAALIEAIPRALKARTDPVGAALDDLNEKWQKTIAALKEGGASAEQFAQAEKLYDLQRQDALAAANDNLKEFINSLNFGSNSTYSLGDQEKAARDNLEPYLAAIRSGDISGVDQQKYLAAADAYLQIEREISGSGTSWFAAVDELRTSTQTLVDGLEKGSTASTAIDLFAEKTADSTQATAEILAQQSGQLNDIAAILTTIADNSRIAEFIGTDRYYLSKSVG